MKKHARPIAHAALISAAGLDLHCVGGGSAWLVRAHKLGYSSGWYASFAALYAALVKEGKV